ncbi:hypothetical protein KY290_026176 [Solanum tuberosum]|uniref:RNase H type-1 domain-containing protein n=1 Tax=Solanum tuberosum TaxID=4113 RepID=A0ABQ7UVN6_SOLTU|nr:hypothetical protein KY290_026176 [Solanum tuberosum]
MLNPSGKFTVKSAWEILRQPGDVLGDYKKLWIKGMPFKVSFLVWRTVVWKLLEMGSFKCNSDGASKGNPSPSSGAFCIRNGEGNLFYAEVGRLFDGSNLVAEVVALRLGLEYCVQHNLLPVTLETDSLSLKNILDGSWEIPWGIVMEVKRIKMLMKDKEGLKY